MLSFRQPESPLQHHRHDYIKSASATMLGTRRQANGFNQLLIIFYDNSGTSVRAYTIEILDGWTPKLSLGLLLQEWC
jgi:hypothetical protein